MNNIKFLKHGLKHNGEYFKAHYSYSKKGLTIDEAFITIYGTGHKGLPKVEERENDSDIMTDYFENDKIRILESNPLYKKVLELLIKWDFVNPQFITSN